MLEFKKATDTPTEHLLRRQHSTEYVEGVFSITGETKGMLFGKIKQNTGDATRLSFRWL